MTDNLFDDRVPLDAPRVVAIYEALRGHAPVMPEVKTAPARHPRLRDVLNDFDALLLDGYGVLNTGGALTDTAAQLVDAARANGIATLVLTNGGTRTSAMVAEHYRGRGLDIAAGQVVSSRDALMAAQGNIGSLGVVDSATVMSGLEGKRFIALDASRPVDWLTVDAIGFFGSTLWDGAWQECLENAMQAGVPVHVANADVAAPLGDGIFSHEPGYWVAKCLNEIPDAGDNVSWYGKPHGAVFDLALRRLGMAPGKRIAMVGDTLHTDILGGAAAGLATVLVTGYGLLKDWDADAAIGISGITPDYIVERL